MTKRNRFTQDQKIQIVLESLRTNIATAELCRKYNVHPQTFGDWRQKFIEAGKVGLSHSGSRDPARAMKKERDSLKRIIGELTIANDILKKTLEDGAG